ncbi:hypothetical protein [Elizabethkingia meningoseptica]|uniref:hypothetical protein n=1 Tax=Elizabethkingia meningoseptica TaxID=238 RepID=UPI0023B0659E|nr:hypothetical protein [Elizabethkingia meningoseptica]MDE5429843.1 hypothetical protein [Elizabethkingia meningoseptica]
MKKHLFYPMLWGTLLILLFHGCRTNEDIVKNERQVQGAEYSSKTLWAEDEKYIKNVIKIYDQYKETVNENSHIQGVLFWDYAMTMGQFNESYLKVPVVNQGKVVQILHVIRKGSKIYFSSDSTEKTSLDFFQQFIFGNYTKITGEEERKSKIQNTGGAVADGQYICTTRTISMWYPDNNNNPEGPGHWESSYESRCLWIEIDKTSIIVPCIGAECGSSGGGGGGYTYPDAPPTDMVMPPPPERPIKNLKEYLGCLDQKSSANIKVFANTTGMVGHAFISIQQGFNIRTFGFYPENIFPENISGPGIMGDNSTDHYDVVLNMGTVTPAQLQHIIRKAAEYNDQAYSLYYSNCANFTMDVMQIIKPSIQESNWEKPGTVSDQMIKNGGVKQSGEGPATHINCN